MTSWVPQFSVTENPIVNIIKIRDSNFSVCPILFKHQISNLYGGHYYDNVILAVLIYTHNQYEPNIVVIS